MGCGCRGSGKWKVVSYSGTCLIKDADGTCKEFGSPSEANQAAVQAGLTDFGVKS